MSICGLFAVAELVEASKRRPSTGSGTVAVIELVEMLLLAAADRPCGIAVRVLRRVEAVVRGTSWKENKGIRTGHGPGSD